MASSSFRAAAGDKEERKGDVVINCKKLLIWRGHLEKIKEEVDQALLCVIEGLIVCWKVLRPISSSKAQSQRLMAMLQLRSL